MANLCLTTSNSPGSSAISTHRKANNSLDNTRLLLQATSNNPDNPYTLSHRSKALHLRCRVRKLDVRDLPTNRTPRRCLRPTLACKRPCLATANTRTQILQSSPQQLVRKPVFRFLLPWSPTH
jgi:hypothetical protein